MADASMSTGKVKVCYTCKHYSREPETNDVPDNEWPRLPVVRNGKRTSIKWMKEKCLAKNRLILSRVLIGTESKMIDQREAKQLVLDGAARLYGSEADECNEWNER